MESLMEDFGSVLRYWRQTKGYSQLDLGLAADVSTKHVSFLETTFIIFTLAL